MKIKVIMIVLTLMSMPLLGMNSSCGFELNKLSADETPSWLVIAQHLAEDIKSFGVAQNDGTPGDESDESASTEESEGNEILEERVFLHKAYCSYNAMTKREEKLGTKLCLTTLCNNQLESIKLVENKKIAAAWLYLLYLEHKLEHREFFKDKMFELALIHKKKSTVKYLVKQEKVDIKKPNLLGEIPFHTACKAGDAAIVYFLIMQGALETKDNQKIKKKGIWLANCFEHTEIPGIIARAEAERQSQIKSQKEVAFKTNIACLIQ